MDMDFLGIWDAIHDLQYNKLKEDLDFLGIWDAIHDLQYKVEQLMNDLNKLKEDLKCK